MLEYFFHLFVLLQDTFTSHHRRAQYMCNAHDIVLYALEAYILNTDNILHTY